MSFSEMYHYYDCDAGHEADWIIAIAWVAACELVRSVRKIMAFAATTPMRIARKSRKSLV